jgi:hypothetical protein
MDTLTDSWCCQRSTFYVSKRLLYRILPHRPYITIFRTIIITKCRIPSLVDRSYPDVFAHAHHRTTRFLSPPIPLTSYEALTVLCRLAKERSRRKVALDRFRL